MMQDCLIFWFRLVVFIFYYDIFSSNINFVLPNLPGFWPDGPPGVLWMASIKENCFIFHIFPYELFLWADPTTHFRPPIFKSWLTACLEVCLKSKCWQLMFSFLSLSVNYMLIFKAWRCVIQHLQLILMSLLQTRTSWLSCRILQSVSKSTLIHKPCMISLYLL